MTPVFKNNSHILTLRFDGLSFLSSKVYAVLSFPVQGFINLFLLKTRY